MKDKVLVSFSSYNAPQFLEHLVESIEQHDAGYDYDLLVLDNTSTDQQQKTILEKISKKHRVEVKDNLGRAQGSYDYAWRNNKDYKYYFFLHDDSAILRDNWLKVAVDRMEDTSLERYLSQCKPETLSNSHVGKVGFQAYEWGDKYRYLRTGYKQVFDYMDPIAEMIGIKIPEYYQHINDDRYLIKNELLQRMDKVWNIEHWKQMEECQNQIWISINEWFEKNLQNKTNFYPEPRYGHRYHAFQTVSEFLSDIAPMSHGYRTHCVLGDGYCQEELGWSKFWGNEYIVHYGDHVFFKRMSIILNTLEGSVRTRLQQKNFLHYCDNIVKRETNYVQQ